jgi:hypothetical protein
MYEAELAIGLIAAADQIGENPEDEAFFGMQLLALIGRCEQRHRRRRQLGSGRAGIWRRGQFALL